MKEKYKQKHNDTTKTRLQLFNNKVRKNVYMQNGNKLARAMVAYL